MHILKRNSPLWGGGGGEGKSQSKNCLRQTKTVFCESFPGVNQLFWSGGYFRKEKYQELQGSNEKPYTRQKSYNIKNTLELS